MSRHGHYTETLLTEGMGGRLKTKNGQLVPLARRMNRHQQDVRVDKIRARRTVAAQLLGRMNLLQAYVLLGPIARWKLRRQLRKAQAA